MACAERNDEAPISAPLGAMDSLLRRLDMLACTDDRGSISELKDYIRSISHMLKKLSEVHDPPLTANYWMKHGRELSYDIEAYLDDLDAQKEDDLNDSDANKEDNPDDSYAKMKDCIDDSDDKTECSVDDSDAKMEDSIDDSDDETKDSVDDSDGSMQDSICSSDFKISGFKTRAKGMIDRYESFSLDSVLSCPTAAATIVSPRPSRDVVLVGMDNQITKLISLLQPKDENDNQLKIVSILGDEGIGKSTLIQEIWRVSFKEKEIWHELESEVNIKRAFVRMGKKPDVRMILRSILSQVSMQEPAKDSGVTNLIRDIRKHLEHNRYFILFDDVRSLSVWDVVGRAFPRCSFGSRIITTTSDKEVALACCSYVLEHNYIMEPLSVGDCIELFIRTVGFGTVNLQLSKQVLDEIKRKCGGLPLAIIWTAILVASKLETEQGLSRTEKEQNLDSDLKKFLDENLRTGSTPDEILNQVLKLCYSSLPHCLKTCLLFLSVYPENYFFLKEDLVKLWIVEGFICPSEEDKVEAAGRYFDVLVSLGLIQRTDINCNKQHHQGEVVEHEGEEYPLRVPYVVHPTVFDFITSKSTEDNFITVIDYSQLTVAFKEKIRRLSLHFGSATYASTPESIGLSHVRTLSFMGLLSCMPSLVDFKLVRVLILHLWADDGDKKFPLAEICKLLLLKYLQVRCNVAVELPGRIGCLKNLETLEINSVVTAVPSDVFHLSRLLHLRLGLKQNLALGPFAAVNAISSDELLPPMDNSSCTSTPSVQIFELRLPICIFSRLPKWIPQLRKLSILEIVVRELFTADIDMLADLPALSALSLYVRIPTAGNIVFRRGAFPALKYFRFMCGVLSLDFQEEPVPSLRRLNIGFNLQEIAAESASKDAINKHPRPTKFNVKREHQVEEEYCPPPLDPLSINEQEEVPVIHGPKTEDSTNEQPINLDTMPAKDTHEHANFGIPQFSDLQEDDNSSTQQKSEMSSVDLVTATIEVVVRIKGGLDKFRRNNEECGMIYGLVDTVRTDLMLLEGAPITKDWRLRPVLERLKGTLERTETEVRNCQRPSALVLFFKAKDIAAKLNQLRQDISEKMLALVLATNLSTGTLVHGNGRKMDQNLELLHREMDTIYAALGALLLPLESKLECLERRITSNSMDHARNTNKAETNQRGLIKYSWSVLEASLASNEDIGGGHISTVYKGEINKMPVAIKKFDNVNLLVRERFVDELRLVSKLQHGNVMELLGHCYEYSESLMQEGNDIRVDKNGHIGFVSRYMPNQSLVRIIKGNQPVDWPSLFRIIQGIAKGVHYLHEQRVVHLDLKPKTILLDADMTPRINDFGAARVLVSGADEITPDTENLVPVTKGYMAPELSSDKPRASTKSDVYSFGVILLETISLMCAASENGRPRGPEEWLNRMQGTELTDLFDRQLVDDESLMVATRCVLVGLMCCLPDPAGRPSMQQVVDMLASSCAEQKDSTNIASSSNTGHGFCLNCGEEPHRPVPCDAARSWLDRNKSQASPDDKSLDKAIRDMDEFKSFWLGNMANTLGIEVTDLGFLTEAYEEIVECRRRIRWVHAYGYNYLEPSGDRNNKWDLLDRLLEDANDSLERLQVCAEEVRLTLCATDVEAISETYSASKKKITDLTTETRQHFDNLAKAAETDFLD